METIGEGVVAMFLEDRDLVSIQEVRNLIRDAKKAQAELAKIGQSTLLPL